MAVQNPFINRVTALNYPISFSAMNIEVDSTDNDVTLVLPSQREYYAYQQSVGYFNNIFNGFNITWVAGNNPVKVVAHPDDINGFTPNLPSVSLSINDSVNFKATSNGGWSYVYSGLGGSTALMYKGLIYQSSTQPPRITVLQNTLGFVPALVYNGVGDYSTVLGVNAFDPQKTIVFLGVGNLVNTESNILSKEYAFINPTGGQLQIYTLNNKSASSDDVLSNTPISIWVKN